MTAALQLRPLGKALGTEALGVDLSRLDDATFAWIESAFAEHPVLVFRQQHLTAAELAAFGRRFGTPRQHSLVNYRYPGVPEVSWLRNVDDAGNIDWYGVKRATDWHTDSTYEEVLPLVAMLHALEVPSAKGGTVFADMCAAYEALPQAMKDRLATLTGLHGRTDGPAGVRLYDAAEEMRQTDKQYDERRRPAIILHPVTGRPILFVNPMHVHGFDGMAKEAAWELIEALARHATQEQFVYYHSWQVGDLLIWDERRTMHRGAGDYKPDERRIMLRTIVYPN
jgi:taurine dioxygenase